MTTSQIQVGYAIQRISDDVSLHYGEASGPVRNAADVQVVDSVTGYAFDAPDQESDIHFNVVEGAMDDVFFCWLRNADE